MLAADFVENQRAAPDDDENAGQAGENAEYRGYGGRKIDSSSEAAEIRAGGIGGERDREQRQGGEQKLNNVHGLFPLFVCFNPLPALKAGRYEYLRKAEFTNIVGN